MIITALNPALDQQQKTFLAQSYPLGATSVEVKNTFGFSNNDRILIGEMGQEKSEIVTASTPNANSTTFPIGATLFSHEANTSIIKLQFDQVKFYRATSSSGSYTLLSTVNMDVTSDELITTYDDTTAATGYYYKVSMFNSISLVESALSDPMPAVTGWATNQAGYLIDEIFREIADPTEQFLSRTELLGYFNDVNNDLMTNVGRPYRFLYTRNVYDRTLNRNYFTLPTNTDGTQVIWKFDRLDYRFVDNTPTPATDTTYTVPIEETAYFRNRYNDNTINSTTVNDTIQAATLNDATNSIDYYPASQTTSTYGCFYLYYWKKFTRIDSEGDIFETYSPRIYKLYALSKYYYKRSVTESTYLKLADKYSADYQVEKNSYKKHDRHDKGTPRRFSSENRTTLGFRR